MNQARIDLWTAKRPELVQDEVNRLMEDEYNPFKLVNFLEFMQNAKDSNYMVLCAYAGTANEKDDYVKAMFAGAFLKLLKDYWLDCATKEAEDVVPPVEILAEEL